MTVFETETMAELCVKQGLVTEALAIYRRLVEGASDEAARTRRAGRLAELERIARGVVEARAPAPAPVAGEPSLRLERSGDELRFAWVLPPDTGRPALQLLLLLRGIDGIVSETRTVALEAPRGTTAISVPGLHSVHAAAGRLDGARFVPLARLPSPGV
jgi:hypothetical protein